MFKFKIRLIACLCLTLTGCFQAPQDIPKLSLESRQQYLSEMQHWRAEGRIALRDRDSGHNFSLQWQQDHHNYNLYFYSPLVSDSARLIGKPGSATLITSDGDKFSAASPEHLVQEHLGWSLPFAKLAYWIKGMAAPGAIARQTYDAYNQLQTLEQDGWLIEYQNYAVYMPFTLPEKISFISRDVTLKIVIRDWKK